MTVQTVQLAMLLRVRDKVQHNSYKKESILDKVETKEKRLMEETKKYCSLWYGNGCPKRICCAFCEEVKDCEVACASKRNYRQCNYRTDFWRVFLNEH